MTEPVGSVYLDHNATTPVAPEVVEAMLEALERLWGNPSSTHAPGRAAREAVAQARRHVARLLGCAPESVVFTSGGTESDNLALIGVARARRDQGRLVVISSVEHPAITAACAVLAGEGFTVVEVPVDGEGLVSAAGFIEAMSADTAVASLMHANNETGALQPVQEVAAAARKLGVPLHTDAAQSAGKLPLAVHALGVDLLTVTGHKLYGPKGAGALYVRPGTPLLPLMYGAPQESGRRSGTENTPGIVGLGAACALAADEIEHRVEHARGLVARLLERLRAGWPELVVNGPADPDLRLPNTINVSLMGATAARLLAVVQGVSASAGAACHAETAEPSGVLAAMGVAADRAASALRLSVGRGNTEAQIDAAAERLLEAARRASGVSDRAGPTP